VDQFGEQVYPLDLSAATKQRFERNEAHKELIRKRRRDQNRKKREELRAKAAMDDRVTDQNSQPSEG
jgi:hypothetical protein